MAESYIEHRRHAMRPKPGQHLSQEGVDLARRVGEGMGPFDLVITSALPRAFETSIAMGFAVDRQVEPLSGLPDHMEVAWDEGFGPLARCAREAPESAVARLASVLAEFHLEIARSLPDGGRALIISHGGFIEATAIGCVPELDFEAWGPSCNYCEGIRLTFDGDAFTDCELLRVEGTILEN